MNNAINLGIKHFLNPCKEYQRLDIDLKIGDSLHNTYLNKKELEISNSIFLSLNSQAITKT